MNTTQTERICTLEVVIDEVSYYYEAHSYQRVAEILASQLVVLENLKKDEYYNGKTTIDSFTIHHFAEVE